MADGERRPLTDEQSLQPRLPETIRDRLRVLLPEDPESYYRSRELMPADMLGDMGKAKIVITNYHAFKRRETLDLSKVGRSLLQGRGEALQTIESEGQMLQRACSELMALKNVVIINDEAHHCYREKPESDEETALKGEEKDEAKKNNEAARLWISGIETLKRTVGLRGVYDLSATPFFLRGSGYLEGTLFPWVVSDFSLMDAIECGIVKLPRVPVADSLPAGDMPIYRRLWDHIGKDMPKKGGGSPTSSMTRACSTSNTPTSWEFPSTSRQSPWSRGRRRRSRLCVSRR